MRAKITKRQAGLLEILAETGSVNTHQLAVHIGHRQAYETNLRDRLFRLESRGLVASTKTTKGRFWKVLPAID